MEYTPSGVKNTSIALSIINIKPKYKIQDKEAKVNMKNRNIKQVTPLLQINYNIITINCIKTYLLF